jgi:hypothetical protein
MIGAYDISVATDVLVVTEMRFRNSRLGMMIDRRHGWITLPHCAISMDLGGLGGRKGSFTSFRACASDCRYSPNSGHKSAPAMMTYVPMPTS